MMYAWGMGPEADDKPISLPILARRLRIPVKWLRGECEGGRIPHVKCGSEFLVHAATVDDPMVLMGAYERLLLDRAKSEGMQCATA
ncbi:MAG: hypothetical protein V1790_14400 [Planctomycetota bacterium]